MSDLRDIDPRDLGATVLRLALGALFVAHAGLKLFVFTPSGTAGYFASLGLPSAFAYVIILAELAGGLALILGLWTRAIALALVPILIGAIVLVHGANGFWFMNQGGGWEFPAFWAVALVAQSLLGAGALAVSVKRSSPAVA